jgi:dihydrofolate synthase/folylpolyglutamate synthase
MPARLGMLSAQPLVLLDGGHNPDGARALAAALEENCPGVKFNVICGMMKDKDVIEYLKIIRPLAERFIACAPGNPRALPAEELAERAREAGIASGEKISAAASPEEALRLAGYPVLICGSLYLAGEVRGYWTGGRVAGSLKL